MSFEAKVLAGKNLDISMVPGGIYDLPQELVMRFRVGDEDDVVISVEEFCEIAEKYLNGGVSGKMPDCAKKTVERLAQYL